MSTIRRQIIFSAKNAQDVELLKSKLGLMSDSEVIRLAVIEMASRYLGSGVHVDPSVAMRPGRPRMRKTKEDRTLDKAEDIARSLGGSIVTGEGGGKVLKYTIHEVVNPRRVESFEQEIPLSMASDELVAAQYKPSKAEVEKVLKVMNKKK